MLSTLRIISVILHFRMGSFVIHIIFWPMLSRGMTPINLQHAYLSRLGNNHMVLLASVYNAICQKI